MSKAFKSIFKSKTFQRVQNNKSLQCGILFLLLFIASAAVWPSPQRTNTQLPAELQEIDKSIKEARNKTDPFVRERFIQQESRKLKLTSDEYKKLYALRKQNSEMLPDAPDSLVEQMLWFYQGLSRQQRFNLMRIWFVWISERSSTLTILFVGGRFLWEIPRREKEAKYQAWQVVHTAYGQKMSGARITALEDLHEQGESLARLTLEEEANLSEINLPKVNLIGANLIGVNLSGANLSGANLKNADLSGANLKNANLRDADLWDANLSRADLSGANLSGAEFWNANLSRADLSGANLIGANLRDANLSRADLSGANLSGAKFWGSDLSGADLWGSDLSGAEFWTTNFSGTNLSEADPSEANLSEVIELTENQQRELEQRGAIFHKKWGNARIELL